MRAPATVAAKCARRPVGPARRTARVAGGSWRRVELAPAVACGEGTATVLLPESGGTASAITRTVRWARLSRCRGGLTSLVARPCWLSRLRRSSRAASAGRAPASASGCTAARDAVGHRKCSTRRPRRDPASAARPSPSPVTPCRTLPPTPRLIAVVLTALARHESASRLPRSTFLAAARRAGSAAAAQRRRATAIPPPAHARAARRPRVLPSTRPTAAGRWPPPARAASRPRVTAADPASPRRRGGSDCGRWPTSAPRRRAPLRS